ncbi:MAG: hypothetical protein LUD47_01345 [Clostridia bacterium]|nr:hypothetical protein [Clostridia bacterium]
MVITRDNIDDVLIENGLIKEGFNKRQKIGQKWLGVYDRNLDKIILVTSHIINNGRDKKSVTLLLDCINAAKDIIGLAPRGADPSDVVKQEKRVTALEKTEPTSLVTAGLHEAVKDCILDTIAANDAIMRDLESCDRESIRIIREVYRKDADDKVKANGYDVDAFRKGPRSALQAADDILNDMKLTADTVLDDSSRKAYEFAYDIIEDVRKWRDAAVYSYMKVTDDMLWPLREAARWLSEWDERAVGVDSKSNPRVSVAEIERLGKLWSGDQASLYAAEAKKRIAEI